MNLRTFLKLCSYRVAGYEEIMWGLATGQILSNLEKTIYQYNINYFVHWHIMLLFDINKFIQWVNTNLEQSISLRRALQFEFCFLVGF